MSAAEQLRHLASGMADPDTGLYLDNDDAYYEYDNIKLMVDQFYPIRYNFEYVKCN